MEPILEMYKGLQFGSKALKYTAGIAGAITVIGGAGIAIIRFFKGF